MAENCEGILRLHGRKAYLGRTKGDTADKLYLQDKQPTIVSNPSFLSHATDREYRVIYSNIHMYYPKTLFI